MADETLDEIHAELDTLAKRLGDVAYDSCGQSCAAAPGPRSRSRLIREKLLSGHAATPSSGPRRSSPGRAWRRRGSRARGSGGDEP